MVITQLRQACALALRSARILRNGQLAGQDLARHQRVGHITEGALHGFFVVRHGDVAAHLGQVQVVAQSPAVEEGQRDAGRKRPGLAAAVKQAAQFGAGGAQRACERHAREKRRTRCADLRLGRPELVLGGHDVRALGQQVGRQAHAQWRHLQGVQAHGGRCWPHRRTHQQRQGVGLLSAGLLQLGAQCLGLREQRLHLGKVQPRCGPDVHAPLKYAQAFLAAGDGLVRQQQALLQLTQRQFTLGDLCDQTQRDGAPGRIAGQVVLQGRVVQAAHAPPEVDFPAGQAQSHLVLAAQQGLACQVQVARHARAVHAGLGAEGGQQIGALDAIGGPCLLHAQRGDAQVAVVRQRLRNQGLQARVGEIVAPAGGGGRRAGVRARCGVVRGHWQGGRLKRRCHRCATGEHQRGGCQGASSAAGRCRGRGHGYFSST